MTERADVVVIGGGILGASVAHFLAKLRFGTVVLLERGRLCSGATRYSAANVRQHYSNEVGIRLALRAVELFERSAEELGGPTGFVRCGYMVIAGPEGEEAIHSNVALQRRLGVETDVLGVDEIARRFAQLDLTGITLGCLETRSGYADPCQTVVTLVRAAEPWGLRLEEGTPATGIVVEDDAVAGVETPSGRISTRVVVNAAGPWAAAVGAMAGIDYSLAFSREHEVVFRAPVTAGLPIVSDAAGGIFFRPHGAACVLVGEVYPKEREPCDPDDYDKRADERVLRRMAAALARRVPALEPTILRPDFGGALDHAYSGVYSITDDWYPIVGGEPVLKGYYAAVGGSGHCFKLGPPLGESLAAVIAGLEPPVDIARLRRDRFADGALFGSAWGPGNRA